MGKKRIADMTGEKTEKIPESKKSGKQHGHIADMAAAALTEAAEIEKRAKEAETLSSTQSPTDTTPKEKKSRPKRKRGKQYASIVKLVDKNKLYPLAEAVKLIKKVSLSDFVASVDAHLTVREIGLKGKVNFPHSTGKKRIIRIVDDSLLAELEKGQVKFNVLIASPATMPKIVKYAKLLGPKGLMPNPKSGTIVAEPEKLAKKLSEEANTQPYKTEIKAPLIHITIGKTNMAEKELEENCRTLVEAVGKKNILKLVLAPTMGPGVRVDTASF